jgi:hypothetical protein
MFSFTCKLSPCTCLCLYKSIGTVVSYLVQHNLISYISEWICDLKAKVKLFHVILKPKLSGNSEELKSIHQQSRFI